MNSPVRLSHRSVVLVSGEDAEPFLENLLTQSIGSLAHGQRSWGALLTPQGKVIADLIIERNSDGFLLECAAPVRDDLIQRLTRFRLRARVDIRTREDLAAVAFAGGPDPRSPQAPPRAYLPIAVAPAGDETAQHQATEYQAARIAAGIAEAPMDFAPQEVFPADINMDLTNAEGGGGVDFRKGCFVGQEVVSRMKRRGTARRRTLVLKLSEAPPQPLAAPIPLLANGDDIGLVTSIAGNLALARLRIDRLAEAEAAGAKLLVMGAVARVNRPDWLDEEISALKGGGTTGSV